MIIEINKDIDRYQESIALGLTARQLIYSVASVVVGGGLVLLLYKYIGLTGAAYVAIPCVAPIAMGGFYSYNGMNFYEYMGRRIHFMFGNKPLTFVSTESEAEMKRLDNQDASAKKRLFSFGMKKPKEPDEFDKKFAGEELTPEAEALAEKVKKEDFEAMKKKMKTTVIAVVIGILAMIAAIIVKKFVL